VQESKPVGTKRAVTVAVAARRLNLAPDTVYRAVARGEIPAIRVGRAIRIPESALEPKEAA
jgi:excisionase family DNA binding protein